MARRALITYEMMEGGNKERLPTFHPSNSRSLFGTEVRDKQRDRFPLITFSDIKALLPAQ